MSDTNKTGQVVLFSTEVELFVEKLTTFPIEEIGSSKWLAQHEHIEKLNMQAILSASANETEYVKDSLVTFEKMPTIIHELISVELWKEKVFPQLTKIGFKPKNTFVIYLIKPHFTMKDVCQSIGDSILDLVDYCYRKLTDYIQIYKSKNETSIDSTIENTDTEANTLEELESQRVKIQFDIVIKCLSTLRYIIDNLSVLPLSITNRLLNTNDFILLLIEIMELQIWSKTNKDGKLYKYIDNKWKQIEPEERFQLTKIEGQLWISLYQMLLSPECAAKYEYTQYKKNQIVKLRSHLNAVVIDQIPNLGALQRFLEELAIMEPPVYKSDLIIEQVPEIYDKLMLKYKGKWKDIAIEQSKTVLDPNESEIKEQAKRWADTYNFDVLESLIDEPPKCACCGELAVKRCSRCQNEWYCRRECQVKHWPKHKKVCDLLQDASQIDKAKAEVKT